MSANFPSTDAGLLAWSQNFEALIIATPLVFGLSAPQAAPYSALHTTYSVSLALAVDPSTKTTVTVANKNDARTALKAEARLLANIIDSTSTVTDGQKLALGLTVRQSPNPVPPPADAPKIDVVSVNGWTVSVRLHDGTTTRRAKPAGVAGATVFSYVGANAPTDLNDWKFETNSTLTNFDVELDNALAPGTKVWLTAFWRNGRDQSGPPAVPVSTQINYGGLSQAA